MKKSIYKKLVKEVTKLENKYYLSPYNWTESMLAISKKLDINFKIGSDIRSLEDEIDFIYTACFEDIEVYFYINVGFGGSVKTIKIVVSENN